MHLKCIDNSDVKWGRGHNHEAEAKSSRPHVDISE